MGNWEWIDVRDRMPTADDADASRCVMVWHTLNGVMMTGWHHVRENRFITHWQKAPECPEGVLKGQERQGIHEEIPEKQRKPGEPKERVKPEETEETDEPVEPVEPEETEETEEPDEPEEPEETEETEETEEPDEPVEPDERVDW